MRTPSVVQRANTGAPYHDHTAVAQFFPSTALNFDCNAETFSPDRLLLSESLDVPVRQLSVDTFFLLPPNTRARNSKVGVITASLAFALPVSIAVFPQEARFRTDSLEPELQNLRLKSGSRREVTYLYANKGL